MEQILPCEVLQEKSQHKVPSWAEDEVRKEKQERGGQPASADSLQSRTSNLVQRGN